MIFFDHQGVIYQHEVPQGTTVNADHYIEALKSLKTHIARKRKHYVRNWILHHDNARPHTAARVLEFLAKNKVAVMKHPPYSPDLAPCDFWMFPKLKEVLRGRKFSSNKEIVGAVQAFFKSLEANAFSTCFQKWISRWDRCIESGGRYFEKE
jgi:[histone H3]-lysine36 N-dimethyltransferase SETMAR